MFFLSWRQLAARKKQTLLVLLGISFGTLLFVTISGLQLGMRTYISDRLLDNTAHILISGAERMIEPGEVTTALYSPRENDPKVAWLLPPYGKREETRLENYLGWQSRLAADADVLDFSPRLSVNAILTNGTFTASVGLTGLVPERHRRMTSIEKYVQSGSFTALQGGAASIVIGSLVARDLGARVGSYVSVSTGKSEARPFKVVGITHFGNDQFDRSLAYAELSHVQTLARSPGRVSAIAVALFDIEKASAKAREWKVVGTDKVEDWQEANKVFMEMIRVQDYTRYFITGAILIVAAFGIYNVLSIMINQKKKEIAILRAIGYGPRRILELVLYQGILLGAGGGVIGLALGFLLCRLIGAINLDIEIGGSHNLLVSYDPQIYVTAFLAANAASMLASYLPARAASLLSPMDIIRSES